jgi:hypothetical protein
MNWKLEVEDVAWAVDDMKKIRKYTCSVFTFLGSESDGMEVEEGEQGFRVQIDGKAEDAAGATLWPVSVHAT